MWQRISKELPWLGIKSQTSRARFLIHPGTRTPIIYTNQRFFTCRPAHTHIEYLTRHDVTGSAPQTTYIPPPWVFSIPGSVWWFYFRAPQQSPQAHPCPPLFESSIATYLYVTPIYLLFGRTPWAHNIIMWGGEGAWPKLYDLLLWSLFDLLSFWLHLDLPLSMRHRARRAGV